MLPPQQMKFNSAAFWTSFYHSCFRERSLHFRTCILDYLEEMCWCEHKGCVLLLVIKEYTE